MIPVAVAGVFDVVERQFIIRPFRFRSESVFAARERENEAVRAPFVVNSGFDLRFQLVPISTANECRGRPEIMASHLCLRMIYLEVRCGKHDVIISQFNSCLKMGTFILTTQYIPLHSIKVSTPSNSRGSSLSSEFFFKSSLRSLTRLAAPFRRAGSSVSSLFL